MLSVINAIRQISTLTPSLIPKVALPQVPDINPAAELAQITGGSPLNIQAEAHKLFSDIEGMDQIEAQAHALVQACIQDLVSIGIETLARAVPVALGLLIPNPAARLAAEALLREIAREAVQQAVSRIAQLVAQLAQLAIPLLAIAAKKAQATIIDSAVRSNPVASALAHPALGNPALGNPALGNPALPAPELLPAGSATPETSPPHSLASGIKWTAGKAAADAALSQIGTPYAWGGSSSNAFDCSGLTQWAYRQAGIELPRLAQEQAVGTQVPASELQPGDLAVWDGHVAMYAGDGQLVEAGDPVQVNPLRTSNMGMAFKGFWRPTQ